MDTASRMDVWPRHSRAGSHVDLRASAAALCPDRLNAPICVLAAPAAVLWQACPAWSPPGPASDISSALVRARCRQLTTGTAPRLVGVAADPASPERLPMSTSGALAQSRRRTSRAWPATTWAAGRRLHPALLPILSLVVFLRSGSSPRPPGSGTRPSCPTRDGLAGVPRRLDHPRRSPGYAGYLLWEHLYMTLRRVFVGVVIGVGLGVMLGLLMGTVRWFRRVLEPWLTFLRALPPLAYFSLFVIWFGIDETPKLRLLALAALPPAAVATTAAAVARPTGLVEAARALGANRVAGHPGRRTATRCPRSSPASAWPSASRTPRSSPPRLSTASPASAAWSRTPQLQQHRGRGGRPLRHRHLGLVIDGLLRAAETRARSPGGDALTPDTTPACAHERRWPPARWRSPCAAACGDGGAAAGPEQPTIRMPTSRSPAAT